MAELFGVDTGPVSEMQLRLEAVRARLAPMYADEEIELWLRVSHPMLMGERPIRLIMGNRMEPIWRIIDQLESGAFV